MTTPTYDTETLHRFHHAAIDNANEAIIWIDQSAHFFYFNESTCRSLGYTREEMAHLTVSDVNPTMPPEEWPDLWRQLVERGEIVFETLHRHKDGSTFPVEASVHHLIFDGRDYACVSVRDIRARKRAQERHQRAERRYRTLTEMSPVGIFRTDSTGLCLFVNRRWSELTGLSETEAMGEGWSDALHPEDRDTVFHTWQEAARLRVPFQLEYRFLHKDGTVRWVIGQAVGESDEDGQVSAYVGTITDITAYKEAELDRLHLEEARRNLEAQVQHAQKLESLGVLAGGIAHDFNNLLGGILGNAELALKRMDPASAERPLLLEIAHAADRCAELSNQMLAYSGKGNFVLEWMDLGRMVREMVDLLHLSISKKARLHFELSEDLPTIEGDPTQIRQVVMNLITNASDALGNDNGHIYLRTGLLSFSPAADPLHLGRDLETGSYVFLEVEDSGCGMDEVTRARLFDPFFTTKISGRGLGMAATLGIVRAHRGAIQLESAPEEGTIFRVLFPATNHLPTSTSGALAECPTTWQGSGVILVVDDEKVVRVLARSILEDAGFEVLECSNGRLALDAFKEHGDNIVAVLLDMSMPELDGSETFRELRRLCPEVRVILSSGYSESVALRRFGEEGIAGFIQKPYRPSSLLEKVREILAAP